MALSKLFEIPPHITEDNFEEVMHQAIALELATIPTYLSTYYSIKRAQDQDTVYARVLSQLPAGSEALAEQMTLDILVYANKSAAYIMSVVIEEMLHLALSSNVKTAICQKAPELVKIATKVKFPTQLDGHRPEFPINIDKLSLEQLTVFLQIESPNTFVDPGQPDEPDTPGTPLDYTTIGAFYDMIIAFVKKHYPGPYEPRPQLLPDQPFYGQNSINTVYYDRNHKPQFGSEDDSGVLRHVVDAPTAVAAMEEIIHQGEGRVNDDEAYDKLEFDKNGLPVPLPVKNGKVQFKPGDYDDNTKDHKGKKELSHFGKFMEIYSLGVHYQEKFKGYNMKFFDELVYNQTVNPKQSEYPEDTALSMASKMGNALFTYIILMVETCYYKDEDTQFKVFMYGIHKSMIWLLSEFGNGMNAYTFKRDDTVYEASLTFEYYDFSKDSASPKEQMIRMANELAQLDSNWEWLLTDKTYLLALPDVGLDHSVKPNVPEVPAS
ncbi:MAG: hypothetical protein HEP71_15900 [Roseivirga sp.]|nr:hypothetical protein [Roseivirga sp.]